MTYLDDRPPADDDKPAPDEAMAELIRLEYPCQRCFRRPLKWRGHDNLLCLHCARDEHEAWERRRLAAGGTAYSSFVGPECVLCGSEDVDADGSEWWCNASGCTMRLRQVYQ